MAEILLRLAEGFWNTLAEMSPYLILGFAAAGILSVLISQDTVRDQIGRPGAASVFKASLFGVPLPLCSCGVIPVGMSLRKHGASRGAATAFLISTPQTGADNILVILSLLGPVFAVVSPVAALFTGFAGGLLVDKLTEKDNGFEEQASVCTDECCDPDSGHGKLYRAMKFAFATLPRDIGKFLLIGLIVAAVISAVVPKDYFSHTLGTGLAPMLLMMLVGIPMYVCSTASVPIAAALIVAGISPGAALVFLMTGPATNAATIATVWKELGRRTAIVYLATISGGALAFGFVLDFFEFGPGASLPDRIPWEMPGFVKIASAIVIIAMLAPALLRREAECNDAGARPAPKNGGRK